MSAASINQNTGAIPLTLGDLLYADPAITCVQEKDWLALVRAVAAGEQLALRTLFEKTYPLVFAYLLRLTDDRRMTENLILEVFEIVWCEAPVFDSASAPVLGWIMRQARSIALAQVNRAEPPQHRSDTLVSSILQGLDRTDAGSRPTPADLQLRMALEELTVHEREVIEATMIEGLSYAEVAARRNESVGTIKNRINSGLLKLRRSLPGKGGEA